MLTALLFITGAALGSFLNVVSMRYNPDRFLLHPGIIGGRSRCNSCSVRLRWYELIPLVSFLFQRGKCRRCATKLSWQYPLVELASGLIVAAIPWRVAAYAVSPSAVALISLLWILVFLTLLLLSLIDWRLFLIPNEANVFLALLGIILLAVSQSQTIPLPLSSLGSSGLLFGLQESALANRALALLVALVLFGGLVLFTRGRGMGLGDVKLALALALVFGWPDILLLSAIGFVFGGIVGAAALLTQRKTMKSALPFGPFLAFAALTLFFFGTFLVREYLEWIVI